MFQVLPRLLNVPHCLQVWMELLSQAPQQYVVAASCPWMGAWLCLMMQASHIPIDLNMLLEVKARSKVRWLPLKMAAYFK